MKQKIANYTVVIEKDKRTGTNKACYTASVPFLDIATEANTLKQAQKNVLALVQFHLESLAEEGEKILVEKEHVVVTTIKALLPKNTSLSFS